MVLALLEQSCAKPCAIAAESLEETLTHSRIRSYGVAKHEKWLSNSVYLTLTLRSNVITDTAEAKWKFLLDVVCFRRKPKHVEFKNKSKLRKYVFKHVFSQCTKKVLSQSRALDESPMSHKKCIVISSVLRLGFCF